MTNVSFFRKIEATWWEL